MGSGLIRWWWVFLFMHGLQTGRRKLSNRLVIHGLHTRRAMVAPRKKKKKEKDSCVCVQALSCPTWDIKGGKKKGSHVRGWRKRFFRPAPPKGPTCPSGTGRGLRFFRWACPPALSPFFTRPSLFSSLHHSQYDVVCWFQPIAACTSVRAPWHHLVEEGGHCVPEGTSCTQKCRRLPLWPSSRFFFSLSFLVRNVLLTMRLLSPGEATGCC